MSRDASAHRREADRCRPKASASMHASRRAHFGCHAAAFSQRTVTKETGQQTIVAVMVRNLQVKVVVPSRPVERRL